jgi:hypothetical protein
MRLADEILRQQEKPQSEANAVCEDLRARQVRFRDDTGRQPDLAHLTTLAPRLTPDARIAILRIMQACADRGAKVRGFDVYRSVLDDAVRTPEQFDQWRARQASR